MKADTRPPAPANARDFAYAVALTVLLVCSLHYFAVVAGPPNASAPDHDREATPHTRRNQSIAEVQAPKSGHPTTLLTPTTTASFATFSSDISLPPRNRMAELPPPPSGDYDLTLTTAQIESLVEKRYGTFFQSLDLPAGAVARLRVLLAERQQVTIDAANSALLVGLDPIRDLSTIREAIAQVQAAVDTNLRAEFGDVVFGAYRESERLMRERNTVDDFAELLTAAREPLRPEQGRQLLVALGDQPREETLVGFAQAIYGGVGERAQISEQAIATVAKGLSSRQVEILRQLQQRNVLAAERR